jgi:hypothetical protein
MEVGTMSRTIKELYPEADNVRSGRYTRTIKEYGAPDLIETVNGYSVNWDKFKGWDVTSALAFCNID